MKIYTIVLVAALSVHSEAAPHHVREAHKVPSSFKDGVKWELQGVPHTPETVFRSTQLAQPHQVGVHQPTRVEAYDPGYNQVGLHHPFVKQVGVHQPLVKEVVVHVPTYDQAGGYRPTYSHVGVQQSTYKHVGVHQPLVKQVGVHVPTYNEFGAYQPTYKYVGVHQPIVKHVEDLGQLITKSECISHLTTHST